MYIATTRTITLWFNDQRFYDVETNPLNRIHSKSPLTQHISLFRVHTLPDLLPIQSHEPLVLPCPSIPGWLLCQKLFATKR